MEPKFWHKHYHHMVGRRSSPSLSLRENDLDPAECEYTMEMCPFPYEIIQTAHKLPLKVGIRAESASEALQYAFKRVQKEYCIRAYVFYRGDLLEGCCEIR